MDITSVVSNYLCHSCGACQAICPAHAINFNVTSMGLYVPYIEYTHCTGCALCYKVCAGANFSQESENKLKVLSDPLIGNVLQVYVGKTKDSATYNNSQSGGMVTAVLSYLLEAGEIDGAVVIKTDEANPPYAGPVVARTREALAASQKSKYLPVNLVSIFKEAEALDGRLAVVGLACHLHGLKNLLEHKEGLREKIKYNLGLICGGTMSYGATDFLVEQSRMAQGDLKEMIFRDKSNQDYVNADVSLVDRANNKHTIPSRVRFELKKYFTPPRCKICFDKMNIFSDITFGDPWGCQGIDEERGESLVIVRTRQGNDLMARMSSDGVVTMRVVGLEEALKGQNIEGKKLDYEGYIEAYHETGLGEPNYQIIANQKGGDDYKERAAACRKYLKTFLYLDSLSRERAMSYVRRRLLLSEVIFKMKGLAKNLIMGK